MYLGDWENDKKYGEGKETYPNQDSYQGQFLNGKPHGFGVFTSQEETFQGEWLNGLRHGHGK